jgi:hypothetical protein
MFMLVLVPAKSTVIPCWVPIDTSHDICSQTMANNGILKQNKMKAMVSYVCTCVSYRCTLGTVRVRRTEQLVLTEKPKGSCNLC